MKAAIFHTAFGWAGAAATDKGLTRIVLPKKDKKDVWRELGCPESEIPGSGAKASRLLDKAVVLLTRYFSGERIFFDLPLDIRSYTLFQQTVWRAAMRILPGETKSYAWIARNIKRPRAARAVGQAMGANPLPIVIP